MRAILTALILSWACLGTATSQDFPEPKNAISISALPLAARSLSFSYARRLKNGCEITLSPRFQPASTKAATQPGTDQGSNSWGPFHILNTNPQSWYNHYILRIGLRIPLTETFGYEPQLQLGYGEFYNKVLQTYDTEGDAYDKYQRMDRQYISSGIVNTVNWVYDVNHFRMKLFAGLGTHFRRYYEKQFQSYRWTHEMPYDGPQRTAFNNGHFTVHGGFELGYRF